MANEFRDIAGKTAKVVAKQARRRGVYLSLSDEEIRSFLAGAIDAGERLETYADLRPHRDCPRVPRGRRVEDGFGGKTAPRKMVGAAFNIAVVASGEWDFPDPKHTTALYGGIDSLAGRLLVEFNPVTSGCEHVMAVTDRHLMLVRIRGGVGRKLGPSLVPWWVPRAQVTACRSHGEGDLGLGFADSSWIRLHGTPSAESKARAEAVRACFPHVPGPWPGDKPPKK